MKLGRTLGAQFFGTTVLAALVTACTAPVGAPLSSVPFDSAGRCAEYCTKMGMGLGAVVVMANNVGCVCTPMGHASSAALEGGPAAAGIVTVIAQQQAAMAAQQQRASGH